MSTPRTPTPRTPTPPTPREHLADEVSVLLNTYGLYHRAKQLVDALDEFHLAYAALRKED